jgi:hypothetical protein
MKRNLRYFSGAALVFLALAEVLCEDIALLGGLSAAIRRLLVYAGFCFDIFFTAWFLVGLYTASLNRKARRYFIHEGGWMDFLAAVPLLVLHSGPALFGLAAGGLFVLPSVTRITGGLRFLRFLKLFRIGLAPMRAAGGAALCVAAIVAALSFLGPAISGQGVLERRILDGYVSAASKLAGSPTEELGRAAREYSRTTPELLLVKREASPVYSRYDETYYTKYYAPADYLWLREKGLEVYFSLKPFLAEEAPRGVSWFCLLAALFPALVLYARIRTARTKRP